MMEVEGGASTSSPLWTCPDCDGVGRIAERKDDIYNGERSFPQCVAMYECARKNGMPASGRHG